MGKPGKSKGEKSMKTHSVKFNFIMNAILTVSSVLFPLITFPYISRVLLVAGNGKVALCDVGRFLFYDVCIAWTADLRRARLCKSAG